MKTSLLLAAVFLAVPFGSVAGNTNDSDLGTLVKQYLSGCELHVDDAGKPKALVSSTGEVVDLKVIAGETPSPKGKTVPGYWYSPSMEFLGRQKLHARNQEEAANVIKLLHSLQRGPSFVKQKLYHARRFDGGWAVEVDHDFTTYPGNVRVIEPYELLVDGEHHVVQCRQRCYSYPGSASIYSNTVSSVYEREIKRNRGVNYPEVLVEELRKEWAKEKQKETVQPSNSEGLQQPH